MPGPAPVSRKPIRAPIGPSAPTRKPIQRQPPIVFPAGSAEEQPQERAASRVPAARPPIPVHGGRVQAVPGLVGSMVATTADSATHLASSVLSRSATTRSREAGLRLFGDYSYVKRDLRRIAILTISALALLVIVSFLLPLWLK